MKVFRVQNNLGKGCYRGTFNRSWRVKDHNSSETPSPERDGLGLVMHDALIYGFKSLDQLNAWFAIEELQSLSELGFRAYMIELADTCEYHEGTKQVVFDADRIICEKVLDMNEVLNYYDIKNDAVNYSKGA